MTRNTWNGMAALCAAVAVLAGIASALGVFARGDGATALVTSVRGETYEMAVNGVYAYNAQRVVAEGVGWDIFTLLIAVPALMLTVPGVRRGAFAARLLASGLLGYFVYMYLEYAVTWAFGPLFLLFVVIFATSLAGIVWFGTEIAASGIEGRFTERFPVRSWATISIGLAALLSMLWLQRIFVGLTAEQIKIDGETTMTVQALDLGVMVPAAIFTATLALRRRAVGYVLSAVFAVTYLAMTSAITGMLLSAWAVEGQLEIVPVTIFVVAATASIVVITRMYRSITAQAAQVGQPRLDQAVGAVPG
jgi:hypothetical protein